MDSIDDTLTTYGDCEEHRAVCRQNAHDNHSARMAACTIGAVVASIVTAGPGGAASWPICVTASGLQWENDMEACQDHYEICVN